jgi:hypothetical protein
MRHGKASKPGAGAILDKGRESPLLVRTSTREGLPQPLH